MTEFLSFLYSQYIRPYLDTQPMDYEDCCRHGAWDMARTEELQGDVDALVRFAAVHSFLLGLRTGEGLREHKPEM